MKEELREPIIELLIQKATLGLDLEELQQLEQLQTEAGIRDDDGFDLAAAAIGLVDLEIDEQLPMHLRSRIAASADDYFATLLQLKDVQVPAAMESRDDEYQKVFTVERVRSWNWLGWAVAAAACIALAVNVWFTKVNSSQIVTNVPTPVPTLEKLTPQQEMASILASQANVTRASWTAGTMKDLKEIGGEVVWSDEQQKGFMRLRGLPVNDSSKQSYQLWIVDKTRDAKHPIDGGVFDVPSNGEVVIPINAKLQTHKPEMFVITVEQPGGVVVSEQGKVAAIAKV